MQITPDASVIVVNYNSAVLLEPCLKALARSANRLEIIVVDNASTDDSVDVLNGISATVDLVIVESAQNLGFAGGANLGAEAARSGVLVFMNPDVIVEQGCIGGLVAHLAQHPGVASPVVELATSEPHTFQYGGTIDLFGVPVMLSSPERAPLFVSGCILATNRAVFDQVGGFDGRYFMFMEDVEYGWRVLAAGYEVGVACQVVAVHLGGGSTRGGYERNARLETTMFRVAYRERNSITVVIACAPAAALPLMIVLGLARLFVVTFLIMTNGQIKASRILLAGIVWNVRQLPATVSRRRSFRGIGTQKRETLRRIQKTPAWLRTVRRVGIPVIVKAR